MRLLTVFVFATAIPFSAHAQSAYGRIVGRVTDAAGAVVPGASIRVVHIQTNVGTSANTN